jgi:phospholipase C
MRVRRRTLLTVLFLVPFLCPRQTLAEGNLQKVNHIIVIMQENHSFDDYFGALAYAPNSPYHNANGSCLPSDHQCVDGLACTSDLSGNLACTNSNLDDDGSTVAAFHDPSRCVSPDLDHSWLGTHHEANYLNPNSTLTNFLSDGFIRVNDLTEQGDNGTETGADDQTIGFYNQDDIAFYYDLAQKFAINDRYFASVLGPTFPNRSYLMAATSFGHLTTSDDAPPNPFSPNAGYKPITGTIFDLLDQNGVSWADYFSDIPQGLSFRPFFVNTDPHFLPAQIFLAQAAGLSGFGSLPQVSFVDPNFGFFGRQFETDEHPPTDIQRGQAFVSQLVNAVRNGPNWNDSIILITYDEHGGFYDHAQSPRAKQPGSRTPDGISPGQCADLSNPPASEQPGGGAECSTNLLDPADNSVQDAEDLCPALALDPTGLYPAQCASFDQLGVRVPFLAVSPFSKPGYVSHAIGDHTSILALIERRFLTVNEVRLHLTLRDELANPLEDMFDFDHSPSVNTAVGQAAPPANDCTP